MSIVLSIESLNTPLNSPICGINTELFEIGLDIFYFWPERQSLMNKSHLVESLKSDLRQRYDRAVAALAGAHEAATGADTVFPAFARENLPLLKEKLMRSAKKQGDEAARLHLLKMAERITRILKD